MGCHNDLYFLHCFLFLTHVTWSTFREITLQVPAIYADDVIQYESRTSSATNPLFIQMMSCLDSITSWLSNRFSVSKDKTNIMWCSSRQHWRSRSSMPIRIRNSFVQTSSSTLSWSLSGLRYILQNTVHVTKTVDACLFLYPLSVLCLVVLYSSSSCLLSFLDGTSASFF